MSKFQSLKKSASLGALGLMLALPAWSEDLGVILSNLSHRTQPDLASGPAADRIERALRDAGFSTVTLQNQRRGEASQRLAALVDRMTKSDRLVIVVNGHVVQTTRETYLLGPRASDPGGFDVGVEGIPIGPLMDIAASKPGASIVAIATQRRAARVNSGVTAGYRPGQIPQGVTVLTGRTVALSDLFTESLLVPGRPVAAALEDHPGVAGYGFVPAMSAFIPGDGPMVVAEAEAPKSREEILAETEAALGLNRSARRKVQQSLAILGFDPRGIDGVFGPGSRRAIGNWQVARGYDRTGYLNREVVDALLAEGDARAAELEEQARQRQAAEDARDTAYWRDTGQGADEPGLRAYLARYPDGLFSDIAKTRLEGIEAARRSEVSSQERKDWDSVVEEDTARGYRAYLNAYPDGAFVEEAEARLEERSKEENNAEEIARLEAAERKVAGSSTARKLVENRLTALGLEPGPVDGKFDDATRKALRRYQQARGLPVTGYVNQGTMVRLLIGN